jgi:26S proteasome regulatory subunit N7
VEELLHEDPYMAQHTRYYVRELRIRAYAQILQSYKSVTLESLARSFGVSVEFIDRCDSERAVWRSMR